MTKLHKILFGSALVAMTNLALAQSSTATDSTTTTPSAPSTLPAAGTSGTTDVSSGAAATTNPAVSGSTDPYVQRREARKQAKADYKATKKTAKQEYKAEKREANAALKASGDAPGVQRNTDGVSSSGK